MTAPSATSGTDYALLTDLYQLTMLQAYVAEGMSDVAVFDLFVRRLPKNRNYLVAAGLADALSFLSSLSFSDSALNYLDRTGLFQASFLEYLRGLKFRGDVRAVPEGTVVFPDEPIIELSASLPEAQLVETFLLNQVHFQTLVASKASRVVHAARDRAVVDFGLRRYHGIDAGLKAARACYIAGVAATSNVLAGSRYGIPIAGTMAHSYILSHDSEEDAFSQFTSLYPETVLLVDTYDTLRGVEKVIELAMRMGKDFHVKAVRLDSGDLLSLSRAARQMLDEAGLTGVGIFVSGDLDEYEITRLLEAEAPVSGFGVGTKMGTSADAPFLNSAYKLVSYGARARMKLSPGKATLPGRKQIFRQYDEDGFASDIIGLADESVAGEPLLQAVMREGRVCEGAVPRLSDSRSLCQRQVAGLPHRLRSLIPTPEVFEVRLSPELSAERERLWARLSTQPSAR